MGLAVAAVIALGAALTRSRSPHRSVASTDGTVRTNTVPIIETDLSDSQILPGTLGFGAQTPVLGRGDGIVTQLPVVGSATARGRSLYRVDDQPVPVFYGKTPLFRTLRRPVAPKPPAVLDLGTTDPDRTPRGPSSPLATPPASPPKPVSPLRGRDVTVVAQNLRALGYDIGGQPGKGAAVYTSALWMHTSGTRPKRRC
jgi:hypothetical protein